MPEIKALGLSHPIGFVAMPRTDEWRDDLAHFKMQMGELRPLSGANACDLMAAMHLIAAKTSIISRWA